MTHNTMRASYKLYMINFICEIQNSDILRAEQGDARRGDMAARQFEKEQKDADGSIRPGKSPTLRPSRASKVTVVNDSSRSTNEQIST